MELFLTKGIQANCDLCKKIGIKAGINVRCAFMATFLWDFLECFICRKWRGHMQEKFCLQEMAWVNGKLLDYYDQKQAKKAQK